jgi:glyceraldehyde 3-phosphate dehydrogenase
MAVKVAINGFGRIGRLVFRAIAEQGLIGKDVEVVAVGDIVPADNLAYLLKYDSTQGRFKGEVGSKKSTPDKAEDDVLVVNGKEIKVVSARTPGELPWKDLGVQIVIESTGLFTDAAKDNPKSSYGHITAGAKKVIISAPAKNEDITVVMGVNNDKYDPAKHTVVSNASCTTNCLAPMAKVLHDSFGIERGYMVTIHAYTGDQNTVDTLHKDLHRARAAAVSAIPTSTGAARAVGLVLPELKGKLDGTAIRIPTANVSLVSLDVNLKKPATKDQVNAAMQDASKGALKGILDYNTEPLVSIDFNHCPASCTFDATQTAVVDGALVRVMGWYDNEWGFSNRMSDTAALFGSL